MGINILHLITGLPIGGAEKVLLDLCINLDKKRFTNFVIGLNDEKDFTLDFKKNGIFVKNLNMKKKPKSFMQTALYINRFIEDHDIHILHAHMFHPLVFAFIAKLKYSKLKVVFTSHNVNIGSKKREMITYLLKPFRDVDIVFSSDMITKIYKRNCIVIPNGIDTKPYMRKTRKNDIFTFISVGVLRRQKNQLFLPSAAAYLKQKGIKDFQIQIVGGADASGDMREDIENQIKKYGVENEIKMLGPRRDVSELLQKAHCFVMPSHFEGLPIALLEAAAAGLSVVSTPVGAIASVIDDDSGYLTDIEYFADKMLEVITDTNEAKRRAKNLQKKVIDSFSIESTVKAHEKIYEKI